MKKTTLLLATFAVSLMVATTSFALVTHVFITKDTYACIGGNDTTVALLSKLIDSNDTAAIAALCQQGKVVPVKKGWEVDVPDTVPGQIGISQMVNVYLGPELQVRLKASDMWLRRDCLSTEKVAEDPFNPADLPRVPIHKGRRRPTEQEQIRLVEANTNHGISLFVDQGTSVHPWATRAIALMFHLEKEIAINGRNMVTDPYVTYGPVPDAHNATDAAYEDHSWLVEVSFYILNEPTKRWTAVLHVRENREPVSCELGADIPTLKDNELQPEPVAADGKAKRGNTADPVHSGESGNQVSLRAQHSATPPGSSDSEEAETPTAAPKLDSKSDVMAFVKGFWSHNASNDPSDWASDFATRSVYCYSNTGLADREFIRRDRAKLVERYPVRHYEFHAPDIQMTGGDNSARVTFSFSYSYSGRRVTAGSGRVSLIVQNIGGRWQILDYEEKIDRQ